MAVSLTASPSDAAPVGTMITWKAAVFDTVSGDLWYRFRAREAGGAFRTIRDYGPSSTLDWTSFSSLLDLGLRFDPGQVR